jgi:hypothetical protein
MRIGRDARDRLCHAHTWLDALKTLRLLRGVEQREGLATLDWTAAVQRAPFVAVQPSDLGAMLGHLRGLEGRGAQHRGVPSLIAGIR